MAETYVVSQIGAGVQTQPGTAEVRNLAQGVTVGGLASARFGNTVASTRAYRVSFDLTAATAATLALHFRFGGGSVLASVGGRSLTQYGTAEVRNLAQGVTIGGLASARFGNTVASTRAYRVSFDLRAVRIANGANILFAFGGAAKSLQLTGLEATAYGDFRSIYIAYTHGREHLAVGLPTLRRDGEVVFQGWDSFRAGVLELPFTIGGLHSLAFGQAALEAIARPELQALVLEGNGVPSLTFGALDVSHFLRYVTMRTETDGAFVFGVPWLSHSPRSIYLPEDGYYTRFGFFEVGTHQTIEMLSPVEMLRMGEPDVDRLRLRLLGADSLVSGLPWVSRSPRVVPAFTWQSLAFGEHLFRLRRQIIQFVEPDTDPDTYKGVTFGRTWQFFVRNVTREIYPSGFVATRFASSVADVVYAGRALTFGGLESLTFPPRLEQHLVAYRIRRVPMPGLDSFRTVTFWSVRNNARLIAPHSVRSEAHGTPYVWRSLQFVRMTGLNAADSGTPWASFSPRTIGFVSPRQSLEMPHIIVGHTPLRAVFAGLDSFKFEDLYSIKKPIPTILPKWRDVFNAGVPRVWNKTPQVYPSGRSMLDMGLPPMLSFRVRSLLPEAKPSAEYGRPWVLFRDRTIYMNGVCNTVVSDKLRVYNFDTKPTLQAVLFGDDNDFLDFGLGTSVRLQTIIFTYKDSLNYAEYGRFAVSSNGILFRPGDYKDKGMMEFGTAILSGGVRSITPESIEPASEPTKFRLSPHTIWMWPEPPAQAVRNHSGPLFRHPGVDEVGFVDSRWPFFGHHRVYTPGDALIEMRGTPPTSFQSYNYALVELRRRYIYLPGLHSFRAGYPTVTTATKQGFDIVTKQDIWTAFGEATVGLFDRELTMWGLPPSAAGTPTVQLKNRPVFAHGDVMTVFGNNTPMVHFPRVYTLGGEGLSLWGDAWVSHSPRTVEMLGEELNQMYWTSYPRRMQVYLRTRYLKTYAGNLFSAFGEASVTSGVAHIRPYGFNGSCVIAFARVEHV